MAAANQPPTGGSTDRVLKIPAPKHVKNQGQEALVMMSPHAKKAIVTLKDATGNIVGKNEIPRPALAHGQDAHAEFEMTIPLGTMIEEAGLENGPATFDIVGANGKETEHSKPATIKVTVANGLIQEPKSRTPPAKPPGSKPPPTANGEEASEVETLRAQLANAQAQLSESQQTQQKPGTASRTNEHEKSSWLEQNPTLAILLFLTMILVVALSFFFGYLLFKTTATTPAPPQPAYTAPVAPPVQPPDVTPPPPTPPAPAPEQVRKHDPEPAWPLKEQKAEPPKEELKKEKKDDDAKKGSRIDKVESTDSALAVKDNPPAEVQPKLVKVLIPNPEQPQQLAQQAVACEPQQPVCLLDSDCANPVYPLYRENCIPSSGFGIRGYATAGASFTIGGGNGIVVRNASYSTGRCAPTVVVQQDRLKGYRFGSRYQGFAVTQCNPIIASPNRQGFVQTRQSRPAGGYQQNRPAIAQTRQPRQAPPQPRQQVVPQQRQLVSWSGR